MVKSYQEKVLIHCDINTAFNNMFTYIRDVIENRKLTENQTLKMFTANPLMTTLNPEVRNIENKILTADNRKYLIQVTYGFSYKSYGEEVMLKLIPYNDNITEVYIQSTSIQKNILTDYGINEKNVNEIIDYIRFLNNNIQYERSLQNNHTDDVVRNRNDIDEIKKWYEFYREGIITEEEFLKKKSDIINR